MNPAAQEIKVGESVTLRLTVKGSGNVQMITEPGFPDLPDFKIYDDKPSGSVGRSGARLQGSRTFSKALVPLLPGEPVVPPIGLTFFNPESTRFETVQTAAIPLEVTPGEGKEDLNLTESLAPTTGKVAVSAPTRPQILSVPPWRGSTLSQWMW